MKNIANSIYLLFTMLLLAGCKTQQTAKNEDHTIQGTWELVEQTNISDLNKAFPQGKPTITFENEKTLKVYGFDGCNRIQTTATTPKKHQIKIDDKVAATMMACHATKDHDFTTLFTQATTYSVTENVLQLKSQNGTLTFHRVALNGKWMLSKVFFGNTKAKDLYPYKKPFINIDINSTTVTGNSACNTISGQMLIYKNTMKFNHLITTRMFCEGVNEKVFTDALSRTTHYKLEGTTLTLLENDKPILELVRQFEE